MTHWLRLCVLTAFVQMWLMLPGSAPAAESAPQWQAGWFIDTHAHLQGRYREAGALRDDFAEAARHAASTLRKLRILASIFMPPPQPHGRRRFLRYDVLHKAARAYPRRFFFLGGGGTLNPLIAESVAAGSVTPELRRKFDAAAQQIMRNGAKGFGEMTALHLSFQWWHPFDAAPPDHPLFLRLADLAARHNVPIDLHMEAVGEDMPTPPRFAQPPNPPTLHENITAFERLLAHNRSARIVWAHAGWDNTGQRTVDVMRRLLAAHPNLYLQVKSGLRMPPGRRRFPGADNYPLDRNGKLRPAWLALFYAFPDRIVFGSDHFYGIPGKTRRIGRGGHANRILQQLPPDLARKIGYENVIELYRLEE